MEKHYPIKQKSYKNRNFIESNQLNHEFKHQIMNQTNRKPGDSLRREQPKHQEEESERPLVTSRMRESQT